MGLVHVPSSPRYCLSSLYETYKILNFSPGTFTSILSKMRYNPLSFLVVSLTVCLVESLSLGPFDEVGLFDSDSYNDASTGLGEPAIFLAEADLQTQPVGEPTFSESSRDPEGSDDLFGTKVHSSISTLPDGGSINSDALVALDPSSSSVDQTQAGLPPSDTHSGSSGILQDLGETLDNYIDEGLNYLLRSVSPFDKECDLKKGGKVPLCCNSPRKELPFAYGCKPYDPSNVDCQYYNYQFCCLGYNPIDHEGVTCTKGFYVGE